jgi:phosphoglycerate dehydrogenase-like enzyme
MSSSKPVAVFLSGEAKILQNVWPEDRVQRIKDRCELYPHPIHIDNLEEHADILSKVDVAFSTWGIPEFDEDMLKKMPRLKSLFYAAGSVQKFARPFLHQEIRVFSAWVANGIPVAEFSLAQILLSCKGYFRNTRDYHSPAGIQDKGSAYKGPGIYNSTVALIGFGVIARKLAELLQPFNLDLLVVDPFVDEAELRTYGATRVSLEEAFERAFVVSNHLPNIPPTQKMITGEHFKRMRPDATFINTGRGQQLVESDLIDVLKARPDLMALLDVTHPEPPEPSSPLFTLPNVQLSSHIAGSISGEVVRMADYMLDEYDRYISGQDTRYEVTLEMLETMA